MRCRWRKKDKLPLDVKEKTGGNEGGKRKTKKEGGLCEKYYERALSRMAKKNLWQFIMGAL